MSRYYFENFVANIETPYENMTSPVIFAISEVKYITNLAPSPNAETNMTMNDSVVMLAPIA